MAVACSARPPEGKNEFLGDRYALVVAFLSDGRGARTNDVAAAQLDAIINLESPATARKVVSLGLEGERRVCFKLAELSVEKRRALAARVSRELGAATLVEVRLDAPCPAPGSVR